MADTPAAEWLPIDALRAWERNPKIHPEAQIKDLMASIKRFGWGSPILARMDGEVIAGHGRLEAARRLGLTRVPVRKLDLDPADAALLALADNRLTETGSWDDDAVARILAEASSGGLDITGLGWNQKEIDALMADLRVAEIDPVAAFDALPDGAPDEVSRAFMLRREDAEELDETLARIGGKAGDALMRLVRERA
jgi:ParB-like chromosome segregation protein Spo0J